MDIKDGSVMPRHATGVNLISVYNQKPSTGSGAEEPLPLFVRVQDQATVQAFCTQTSMRCQIPEQWRHVNYTTPYNQLPRGSEVGSCELRKDARGESYFEFDRQGCGARREWEEGSLDNSRAKDSITLKVKSTDIANLVMDWKKRDPVGAMLFVPDQKNPRAVPIELPPDLGCSCSTALAKGRPAAGNNKVSSGYSALIPVAGTTVSTGYSALMSAGGTSSWNNNRGIGAAPLTSASVSLMGVATLRVASDASFYDATSNFTYASTSGRFYLQASTIFKKDHISIATCVAGRTVEELSYTDPALLLRPLDRYCANRDFDVDEYKNPVNATHRISLRKFRFEGAKQLVIQCQLEACVERPCGVCNQPSAILVGRMLMERKVGVAILKMVLVCYVLWEQVCSMEGIMISACGNKVMIWIVKLLRQSDSIV